MLVRRVTGAPLADTLSQRIWQPLGMEADATWLTERPGPDSLEAAYCCINATLRDYGRFGLLFLNHGRAGDKQIVPAAWIQEATNPQDPQVQWGMLFPNSPEAYGYQWWLTEPGLEHSYAAEGVFFQFVCVMPRHNTIIVKTSAYDDFWDGAMEIEQFTAFDAIGDALEQR
jgi:CubicO group peptidase (beta-lactamase class C family)